MPREMRGIFFGLELRNTSSSEVPAFYLTALAAALGVQKFVLGLWLEAFSAGSCKEYRQQIESRSVH